MATKVMPLASLTLAELEQLHDEKCAAIDAVKALAAEDVSDEDLAAAEAAAVELKEIAAVLEAKRAERAKHDRIAALAATKLPGQTGAEVPAYDKPIRIPANVRRVPNLQGFHGPNAQEDAYKAGLFWAALIGHEDSKRKARDIFGALSGSSTAAGGAVVPDIVENSIVWLREQYGVFRQNARRVPMSSDTLLVPRLTVSVTTAHIGAGSQITPNDPTFAQATVSAVKLASMTYVASELAEDALISIADLLAKDFAYAMAVQEDTDGFLGDGTGTYGSITGVASALGAGATYTAVTGINTVAELNLASFHGTMTKLLNVPGIRPKWYMHSEVYHTGAAPLMTAAGGNTVGSLEQGMAMQPMFLGYPVVFTQVLPTASAAASSLVAYFGDLSMAATMGEKRGIEVQASDQFRFDYDQIAIRATERFGITVHDAGGASSKGPIAGLKLAAT
jgi:HK97 family phage major capsid protein